jgi:hypothetical protein
VEPTFLLSTMQRPARLSVAQGAGSQESQASSVHGIHSSNEWLISRREKGEERYHLFYIR